MKKVIQIMTIIGVGIGLSSVVSMTASASSQYSASHASLVRLVWRKTMKRHAYTATTGSRFSKHLSIRYSNNKSTAKVTWYTDAHEMLYKKYAGHNAIYYHVKSADGSLQGWIWRGYLKNRNGKAPKTQVTDDVTVDSKTMIRTMFPKSTYNSKLTDAANSFETIDDSADVNELRSQAGMSQVVSDYMPFKKMKYIDFYSKNPASMKSIDQALTAQGYDAATRKSFKGWSVGGSVTGLDATLEGIEPGEGIIYLIQQ